MLVRDPCCPGISCPEAIKGSSLALWKPSKEKNSTNGRKLREIVPHQSLVALGTEISRQTVWIGTESLAPKTSEMLK